METQVKKYAQGHLDEGYIWDPHSLHICPPGAWVSQGGADMNDPCSPGTRKAQHHPGQVLHLQGTWVIPASGHKRAAVLFPVQRVLGLQLQAQLSGLVLGALGEVAADGDPPPAQPPRCGQRRRTYLRTLNGDWTRPSKPTWLYLSLAPHLIPEKSRPKRGKGLSQVPWGLDANVVAGVSETQPFSQVTLFFDPRDLHLPS